jgi:hypothetical protein
VKTAKKAALGALAASVLAFVTPMTSASADQGDTLKGGCGFNTDEQATATNGQFQGVEYVLAFSQEAAGTPSTATVSCWIDVNGVEQPGTRITATGNGAIAGQAQISYSAVDGDAVNQCQQVTFADGSTWTASDGNVGTDCPAATQVTIPPQAVIDAINTVIDAVNGVLIADVDPTICPVLVSLAGNYGPVTIAADGDVTVNDPLGLVGKVYDCPPYDPPVA